MYPSASLPAVFTHRPRAGTHTHTHTHTHTFMHTCMHTHMLIHTHTHVLTFWQIYIPFSFFLRMILAFPDHTQVW